jgi:hypothetical protein
MIEYFGGTLTKYLIKIFQECSKRKKRHSFDDMIIVADEFLDSILRDLQLESKIRSYKYTMPKSKGRNNA